MKLAIHQSQGVTLATPIFKKLEFFFFDGENAVIYEDKARTKRMSLTHAKVIMASIVQCSLLGICEEYNDNHNQTVGYFCRWDIYFNDKD